MYNIAENSVCSAYIVILMYIPCSASYRYILHIPRYYTSLNVF